jgi:hypothetical protein
MTPAKAGEEADVPPTAKTFTAPVVLLLVVQSVDKAQMGQKL